MLWICIVRQQWFVSCSYKGNAWFSNWHKEAESAIEEAKRCLEALLDYVFIDNENKYKKKIVGEKEKKHTLDGGGGGEGEGIKSRN